MRGSRDERQTEGDESQSQGNFFARGSVSGATSSFSDYELRVGSENPQKKLLAPLKKVGSWRVADRVKSIDPTSPSFRARRSPLALDCAYH